jgi:RHS repeat-associated protein
MAMSSLAATSQPVLELVAIYVYDAFNRRVGRFVNQVSYFSYTWDGWHEAEEYRNTVLGSQYVWGEELDELVAYRHRASANWARYYVAEGLAHCPSRILDESGTVCEIQEYDPYGKTYRFTGNGAAIDVSAVGNPFGWKGHRVDGETGFIYIRNRYYRSDWGRFLSQDPNGAWFDSLNHGNAYAYGGNQPWLIDDRNGHFGWFGALVGAVVGGVVNGVIAAATGGSLRDVGKAIITGAAGGAVVGSGATLVAAVFTGAASGVVAEATGQAIDGEFSGEKLATSMVTGAAGGLVGGLAAKGTAAVVEKVAGKLREGAAATVSGAANAAPKAAAGKAANGAVDQAAEQVGKNAAPVPNPCPQRTVGQPAPKSPSAATKVDAPPEVFAPKPVKPQDAVGRWEDFLGPGPHSNRHPRLGTPDPDRLVSVDGKRSIRYGSHEMDSKPSKHHYHEETWTYDPVNDVMRVDTLTVRVPLR